MLLLMWVSTVRRRRCTLIRIRRVVVLLVGRLFVIELFG